jgi:hypothetical protein
MNIAIEVLRRERDQAKEQMAALKVRVRELESAISLIEGSAGIDAQKGRHDGELKDRVLDLIVAAGPDGCTPRAIAGKLTAAGRPTSDASVSSTLSRLKGDGKVHNERGLWFAAQPSASVFEDSWGQDDDQEIADEPF